MIYTIYSDVLERLDPDTSGILSTICDHSFQCSCTSKWTYLSCQVRNSSHSCFILKVMDASYIFRSLLLTVYLRQMSLTKSNLNFIFMDLKSKFNYRVENHGNAPAQVVISLRNCLNSFGS